MTVSVEVEEALRAAQELCSYLWNTVNDDDRKGGISIEADDASAETLCALMNDARDRVDNALHAMEIDKSMKGEKP